MLDYVWPIALVVTSNVIYQVCAKAVPEAMEPFVFCVVLVGLEVGWIFAYRAGWEVSTANIIQSGVLAAALVVLGCLAYHEALTWTKVLGVAVCIAGISLISLGQQNLNHTWLGSILGRPVTAPHLADVIE